MKPKKPSKRTIAISNKRKAAWTQQQATKPQPIYARTTITVLDVYLASIAADAARRDNRRLSNWETACATQRPVACGEYRSIDNGRYSRSCKYTHWTYRPLYTSAATIACNGAAILYRAGFVGSMYSRIIRAPTGMRWAQNDGLCLIRLSDGMDYHPTTADLRSPRFAAVVREAMARNYSARLEARREAKRTARFERQFKRDIATTRVTLHDSRRAGNCIEGSLRFAERKLGIDRTAIMAAGHLFMVPAKRLLAVANGETDRAMAAIRAAWNRETTVCI